MNQKLKDLFLGKDYDARQAEFAAYLRTQVAAEHEALFAGRAEVLRAGDTVQIKGTKTQGVVRRVTKETDGSLYARVRVPMGAAIEAPVVIKAAARVVAPVVVKAVTPVAEAVYAQGVVGRLAKARDAVDRGLTAAFNGVEVAFERAVAALDSVGAGSAKAAERTRNYLDSVLPGVEDNRRERDHFINVDRLTKVQKAVAPQPAI
jgi:hypothetical protein